MRLDELQTLIGQWSMETFGPEPTPADVLNHLQLEVEELRDSQDTEEAADCVIFLLTFAYRSGFSLEDAVLAKHEVNRRRRWLPPDEAGVFRHAD